MDETSCVDTSILISLINRREFEGRFLNLVFQSRIFVSVVTLNELIRGAHDELSLNIVTDFSDIMQGMLLTPSETQWLECARVSEKILKEKRRTKESVLLLQNDLLIALGARDAGATLVTCDKKDFSLLRNYVKVPIEFW